MRLQRVSSFALRCDNDNALRPCLRRLPSRSRSRRGKVPECLPVSLIVCLLSRRILHTVYGGKFDEVAALLGILAALPIVMGIGNTMNAALKAMEKPQCVLYAYISGGLATLLLGIPLVMHFKLLGAVLGMIASALAYTITMGVGF